MGDENAATKSFLKQRLSGVDAAKAIEQGGTVVECR